MENEQPTTPAPVEQAPVTPVATPVEQPVTTPAPVEPVKPAEAVVPATPVAPVTPTIPVEDKQFVTKSNKYIFQFPEGTSSEKQIEYMQKVDEELKKYDRVVIDPKVKLFTQEQMPSTPVNKVTVSSTPVQPTAESTPEKKDEFAELFLEE